MRPSHHASQQMELVELTDPPTSGTAMPVQVQSAPATRPTAGSRAIPQSWLSDGVRPLLFAVDGIALTVGALTVGRMTVFAALFAITVLVLFHIAGLHRSRLDLSVLDDVPRLLGNGLAAFALNVAGAALFGWGGVASALLDVSLVTFLAVTLGLVLLGRLASYAFVRGLRRRGLVSHRTLILGAGQVGAQVGSTLVDHPEYGPEPVGFLDSDPHPAVVSLPVIGGHHELAQVLVRHNIRAAVIAFTSLPGSEMVDVIRTCDRMRCEIFIVPRLFEVAHVSHDMDNIWGIPLVRLRRASFRTRTWQLKRTMDIVVSAAALVLLAIPMAIAALGVRLEGGPGVLFRQVRVGLDGRRFTLLKFRSLRPVDDLESATHWNIAHDDRLGPVGRFLRKSSMDELPQLFNILRGDMSLVGPRPERPHFVEQFTAAHPRYVARHRVPCGLTGWAQIHGLRGDTSIGDRARFDNYYIENWSLWLDAKIIIRTLTSVLKGAGG